MQPYFKRYIPYRVYIYKPGGQRFDNTVSPGFFMRYLKDNRSEVLYSTRIDNIGYPTSLNYKPTDKIVLTEKIVWAEPGFNKILYFDLLKGNREQMFGNYNTYCD